MKKMSAIFILAAILAGCSSAPKPKQPNESNRQPVNKTIPIEVQGARQ